MNNSKRRRLAKAAAKIPGRNAMDPKDPRNLARLLSQTGNRKSRRGHRGS